MSIAVAALFIFLGVATVDAELTREWTGQASVEVLLLIRLLGEELLVSGALLQVAGFLGALAALVFAVEVLVAEQSRNELIDDPLEGYNQAVIVWAVGETGRNDPHLAINGWPPPVRGTRRRQGVLSKPRRMLILDFEAVIPWASPSCRAAGASSSDG